MCKLVLRPELVLRSSSYPQSKVTQCTWTGGSGRRRSGSGYGLTGPDDLVLRHAGQVVDINWQ